MELALSSDDFETDCEGRTFPFVEDGDGSRYYGYGHLGAEGFAAAIDDYLRLTDPLEVHDPVGVGAVRHLYAVVTDSADGRFNWRDADGGYVTAQTPGSFALTLVSL
ncbi:hypothetical protein [Mycobacteroides abscessus]|uniref:hypothetical protein n=1 Tax=Mycobacteroides abscessus TaxID=36809 RepID=UPI000C25A9EF|nr:hypothetical protein [Mycobacteroides abscessus]